MRPNFQQRIFAFGLIAILCVLSFSSTQARGLVAPQATGTLINSIWTYTGNMNAYRANFTLSLLPDGKALAAGGYYDDGSDRYLNSSETYDPLTNTWSLAGVMNAFRSYHTATVLLDGRVLLTGGTNAVSILNSAELYNPATRTWSVTGSMTVSRFGHTATRLQDGRVLVAGGCSTTLTCTLTAEIYNPTNGSWQSAAGLPAGARKLHTAVLLQDGSVLVAGGMLPGLTNNSNTYYNSAYRYNPTANTWSVNYPMTTKRSEHNAVLMRNGQVMVVGGYYSYMIGSSKTEVYLDSTEVFNPTSNTWTDLGKSICGSGACSGMRQIAGVLDALGNYILIGGGTPSGGTIHSDVVVRYLDINAPADTWHTVAIDHYLNASRRGSGVLLLPTGLILVAGGNDDEQTGSKTNTAEITFYKIGDTEFNSSSANDGLYLSSATMLANGNIMITGGADVNIAEQNKPCHNNVYLWLHDIEAMDNLPDMINNRCTHTTTLLADGRVAVIGGSQTTGASGAGPGEIYSGGSWKLLTGPSFPSPVTALLPNGDIFILDSSTRPHAYLFNPSKLSFRQTTGDYTGTYSAHTLTLLQNGKVLIVGNTTNAIIEIYDPLTETFSTVAALSKNISGHTATLLPNGKVLIAGGREGGAASGIALDGAYLFNPASNTWNTTGELSMARRFHSAALLPDGSPVVVGGATNLPADTTTIEIYDLVLGTWSAAGDMQVPRRYHTTMLTLKGKLFTFGGLDGGEDPHRLGEQFVFANISSDPRLWRPTVTTATCNGCLLSKKIEVTGSGFTAAGEGSSGGTAQSPANQPLVQIMRLDNQQMQWLTPGTPSSNTHFLSAPITDFPEGPVMVFVYSNGSFQGRVAFLQGVKARLFVPILKR